MVVGDSSARSVGGGRS